MKIAHHVPLASLTSLQAGGVAEQLITIDDTSELSGALQSLNGRRPWLLGYGTNSLVSDHGLPGTSLLLRNALISHSDTTLVAEAGAWWDDVVQYAIHQNLWGIEMMSAIPGGTGAAVVGNIAAYGQAVANTLAYIEVLDMASGRQFHMTPEQLQLDYRYSNLQAAEQVNIMVLRVAFDLSRTPTMDVTYQSAIDAATEGGYDLTTLAGRRDATLLAREKAGSLWDFRDTEHPSHTAGSFFRNPMVSASTAERLMAYDETGKSVALLKQMNQVHGGTSKRVSASHVLLAAGFDRGQAWGPVRLHPDHVLKIENTGGATAQQIHDVAQEIITTVKTKLAIDLHPEVRFLGTFS